MTEKITPFKEKKLKSLWLPKWQCVILEAMPHSEMSRYVERLLSAQPEFQKKPFVSKIAKK